MTAHIQLCEHHPSDGHFPHHHDLTRHHRKRFQDDGLRDTCIESGMIAEGSVYGVLEGSMYSRAVRVHKIIFEALVCLTWKGLITWLEAHHPNQMHSVSALPDQVSDVHGEMSQPEFDELLSSDGLAESLILWNQFLT